MSFAHSLMQTLSRLLRKTNRATTRRSNSPSFEQLEDRRVLSITPASVDLETSELIIQGSQFDDLVTVSELVPGILAVTQISNGELLNSSFDKALVQSIVFQGGDGSDRFTNSTTVNSVAFGEGGADILRGGSGSDFLLGGLGDDTIFGGIGNDDLTGDEGDDLIYGEVGVDFLDGGSGVDTVNGGEGDDTLRGGAGNDLLRGELGNDTLQGEDGADVLLGEADDDVIVGGLGDDQLFGGDGNDRLEGQDGLDELYGNIGNDILYGGSGNDNLIGAEGDDIIFGGSENDTIHGDLGIDSLYGEQGNDVVYGDAGNDLVVGGIGDDQLFGGEGEDRIDGNEGLDSLFGGTEKDVLFAGAGVDYLYGGDADDILFGGTENDVLHGDLGNDVLFGEDGTDHIYGDGGQDLIWGGLGNDQIFGGDGNDRIEGQDGNDSAYGEAGNDVVLGGAGLDLLLGGIGDDGLYGGSENDSLRGDVGNDILYGDDGADTLQGEAGLGFIRGGLGDDQIFGGDGNDHIEGQDGNDVLYGELGNDTISGTNGADTLGGGDGDDILYGGSNNDNLHGDLGNDLLYGEDGADSLFGDIGNDVLLGGGGDDLGSGGEGNDRIEGQDGLDTLLGDLGQDTLLGGNGIDSLYGGEGDDSLYGGNDNDSLRGETGNDFLYGEAGDDALIGLDGNDLLSGGTGSDELYAGIGNDVLIGGDAIDAIHGETGEDLMIGGLVTHNELALAALLAQWGSALSYRSRIDAIEAETFLGHLDSQETVFDDYVPDEVFGGDGQDWIFLPGAMSTYDPLGISSVPEEEPGHPHPVELSPELPVVEGFALLDSLDKLQDYQTNESLHTLIPHAIDFSRRGEHISLFELVRYDLVSHTAVGNGNWSDAATWENGIVPADGAQVLIPYGAEVVVDTILSERIATIRVDGKLSFATDANTQLQVDTVVVSQVGELEIGSLANPIAANVKATLTFTDDGPIDRTWDPFGISRGLITHGNVAMHGAQTTTSLEVLNSVTAGTSVLELSAVPVGWKNGDTIVVAGTTEGTLQDELRTIQGIVGNLVLVAPLRFDHQTDAPGLKIHVANLTRNIVLESEATEVDRLGHVMFMHNKNVDIRYVAFDNLGRTNKLLPVNDPVVDASWQLVPGTGTNPRARYSIHFHRAGTSITDTPALVGGSVVNGSPGWGFVNHSSNADFVDNVAYNVTGAAFVTEVGDETGSFRQNIAIHTLASGDSVESRQTIQDFGHTGDGFWFQGAGISVVDNVSASSQGSAFFYYTRGLKFGGSAATFVSSNLPDPSIAFGNPTIAVDHVPVLAFSGNVGYASGVGLTVQYNLRDALHSQKSLFENSSFWGNLVGVGVPYSHNLVFRNIDIIHDFIPRGEVGVATNAISKNLTFEDLYISGYFHGIDAARQGYTVVRNSQFATQIGVLVRPPLVQNRTVSIEQSLTMLPVPFGIFGFTPQLEVTHRFEATPHIGSTAHLFYNSQVFLNYGPYVNRQLYSTYQLPSAIPFPTASTGVPAQYVGKTTQEIRDQYGLTLFGELAPTNGQTVTSLGGVLGL